MQDNSIKGFLSQVSQHVTLLTVVASIVVFFSNYIYSYFYFKNIVLPYDVVSIPFTFYTKSIIFSLLFTLSESIPIYLLYSRYIKIRNLYHGDFEKLYKKERYIVLAIVKIFMILVLGFFVLFCLCVISNNQMFALIVFYCILGLFIIYTLICLLYFRAGKVRAYIMSDKRVVNLASIKCLRIYSIIIIIFLIISCFLIIAVYALSSSNNTIAGCPGSCEVTLDLVDSSSELNNKSLILFMICENKLFLLKKSDCIPVPKNYKAHVIVIPDDAIISAITQEVPYPEPNKTAKGYVSRLNSNIHQIISRWPSFRARIEIWQQSQ